jgi:hypothetical protein
VQVPGLLVASLGAESQALGHSLVVGAIPPSASSLTNQTISYGTTATFNLTVTNGSGPFTYQWQFNGTNIAGATNNSYTVAGATLAAAGNYTGTVTGLLGGVASSSATLTVLAAIATNPTNLISSVSGKTLTLSWPADHIGWLLQSQTNSLSTGLSTNWVDVAGSVATNAVSFMMDPAQPSVFYRLRFPSGN